MLNPVAGAVVVVVVAETVDKFRGGAGNNSGNGNCDGFFLTKTSKNTPTGTRQNINLF